MVFSCFRVCAFAVLPMFLISMLSITAMMSVSFNRRIALFPMTFITWFVRFILYCLLTISDNPVRAVNQRSMNCLHVGFCVVPIVLRFGFGRSDSGTDSLTMRFCFFSSASCSVNPYARCSFPFSMNDAHISGRPLWITGNSPPSPFLLLGLFIASLYSDTMTFMHYRKLALFCRIYMYMRYSSGSCVRI